MIRISAVYIVAGAVFAVIAAFSAGDRHNPRRWRNAAFWGLFAVSFLAGSELGDFVNGLLVLAMVAVGGLMGLGQGRPATTTPQAREAGAARWGSRLFLPVLIIPAAALVGTLGFPHLSLGGAPIGARSSPWPWSC